MKTLNISEIDVDKIMEKIRAEVEERKLLSGDTVEGTGGAPMQQDDHLHARSRTSSADMDNDTSEAEKEWSIGELCRYHDLDFIHKAYQVILQRLPGADEVNIWLARFRAGELTKKEILALLRYGAEGREKKVGIPGLLGPFILVQLFKIPVLGRVARIFGCIIHLPQLFRNIHGLEYGINTRFDQLNSRFAEIENNLHAIQAMVSQNPGWDNIRSLHESFLRTDSHLSETDSRLSETKRNFEKSVEQLSCELADVARQVREYLVLQEPMSPLSDTEMVRVRKTGGGHDLDALYVAFEERFRGSREDILARQSVYLPYVERAHQQCAGGGDILDVGCGRGEWLELLARDGYAAKGIDLNRAMVTQSRELGLDVEEGDVFDYLTGLEPDSLSVLTGFHIVEHLPLRTMIALVDQAYRVLKPGGMIILETPNPENIIVGSCTFYYDPTHRNPIPPEALKFLLEVRGYQDLEIVRLHENDEYADLKASDISEKIASRFYGPQDYAVIGCKK